MVLQELMEKKDLRIYLNLRLKSLEEHQKKVPELYKPEHRAKQVDRLSGRILELKRLLHSLENGEIKSDCKKMWKHQKEVKEHGKKEK